MEPTPSPDNYRDITLNQALAKVGNAVYAASSLFEDLENSGHVRANGHHLRQELAEYAQNLLRSTWIIPEEPHEHSK